MEESSSRIRSARRRETLPLGPRAKADATRATLLVANPNGGIPTPEITQEEASNPALFEARTKLY